MIGEIVSNSCISDRERRRRHFRKFCAFARLVRRDVIMAMVKCSQRFASGARAPPQTLSDVQSVDGERVGKQRQEEVGSSFLPVPLL